MKNRYVIKKPWFIPAAELVIEDPKQYRVVKRCRSLKVRDLAVINSAGEKLLVTIYQVRNRHYFGKIIFDTKLADDHGLVSGDRVRFTPEKVGRAMRNGHWLP